MSIAGGGFGNGIGRKRSLPGVDHLDLDFPHIVSVSFMRVFDILPLRPKSCILISRALFFD